MRALLLTLALLSALPAAATEEASLPALGDASGGIVSPDDEYRLGRAWLRELRAQAPLVYDPLVLDYTERMAYQLAFHSALDAPILDVSVVDAPDINAFAVPGGIVGINTGLYLSAETESEFASVVAHELGHLSQRHFARQMQQQKNSQWAYLGAMLASIALASQNSEAGYAAAMSTQAAAVQNQLRYTRQFEQEADRLGMQTLVRAGLDPHAMPRFFERLQRTTRIGPVPEFLLTHPLTESRISDTRNRASQYPEKLQQDTLDYQLIRTRLQIRYLGDVPAAVAEIERALTHTNANTAREQSYRYGLSLALLRQRKFDEARTALSPLLQAHPGRIEYLYTSGEIELAAGKPEQARATLRQAIALNPDNYPLSLLTAQILIRTGDVQEAIQLLNHQSQRRPDDPLVWSRLADGYSAAQDAIGVHRSKAEWLFLTGDTNKAVEQLGHALKLAKSNYQLTARLHKRQKEMEASRRMKF